MKELKRIQFTPSFKLYEVTIEVSQIEGCHGGYKDIKETFEVCCRYEETAKQRARRYLTIIYPELEIHSFVISYTIKEIKSEVIR